MRNLQELLRKESIDFCSIQESLLSDDASKVISSFWVHSDFGFCQVSATGRSGGQLCTWKKDCFEASWSFAGNGYLGVVGKWKACVTEVCMLNVYAPQERSLKRLLWEDIGRLLIDLPARRCLFWDFNAVRNEGERKGSMFDIGKAADFNCFIDQNELHELRLGAWKYTWIGYGGLKLSKLDRFLLSRELIDEWHGLSAVVLPRKFSYHCPILLK